MLTTNNGSNIEDIVGDVAKKISDENVIIVSSDEEELYFDRLVDDLKKGITYTAFHNKQLQYKLYRSKFIEYCQTRQQLIEKLLRQINQVTFSQCLHILQTRTLSKAIEYS
jgi:hypothetical protein